MASIASSKSFWKTLREVSPGAIEAEADQRFLLALVGTDDETARLRDLLLTDEATAAEREAADEFLRVLPAAPDADDSKKYAFVLYGSASHDAIGARGENAVPVSGPPDEVATGVVAQRPDLAVALGRRFRRFRVPASQRLIRDACQNNAKFALLSALPGILPWTAVLLPGSSLADILILTKNQIMLVMRLAAVHGQKPGYTKQVKELLGTIGSALGWRTVARELVGLVPAGIGAALKAGIAYSGTFAVGRAALAFYQTGRVLPEKEIRRLYKTGELEAREEVDKLRARK